MGEFRPPPENAEEEEGEIAIGMGVPAGLL
jgi:hypothetical protein